MSSEISKARRLLVAAVKGYVLPDLEARGFVGMPKHKEPVPMWDLHRARTEGGYEVISVIFDERKRPQFYAIINLVPRDGMRIGGDALPSERVTAATLFERVYVQKRSQGVLALLLPKWFSHTWFGFDAKDSETANTEAAKTTCMEFITCLDQAERWWKTRELGPNLVKANVGAVLRDPNAPSPKPDADA